MDYSHLKVEVSLRFKLRLFIRHVIAKFFFFPIIGRLLRGSLRLVAFPINWLQNIVDKARKAQKDIELLMGSSSNVQELGSEYGYSELTEMTGPLVYKLQMDGSYQQPSESEKLYEVAVEKVSNLLQKSDAKTFINFGICYANIDSILASRHPDVNFIGISRVLHTKQFNNLFFSDIKNLELVTGDVFDLFSERDLEGGVLFHSRTLLLLPPSFIEKLYGEAAMAGIQYIIGMEQLGISRQTLNSYQFSDDPRPSVLYRDGMYTHNYPGLLRSAGYEIQDIELVKTAHPHSDYRFLCFQGALSGSPGGSGGR